MTKHHGSEPAGLAATPRSRFHHGPFGRIFRNLDAVEHSDGVFDKLAAAMVDPRQVERPAEGWGTAPPDQAQAGGDNPNIPAGYTYLGQFIDHDLTFDPASSLLRSNDPDALHNFRTPRFDLDSLYGEGPDDEPFLYDQEQPGKMLLGAVEGTEELDLPRNGQGRALIGDPRNDENVIVSQLQLLLLRAHNKLIEAGLDFEAARRELRWHYQWVVVEDFLGRILPEGVLDDLRDEDGRFSKSQLEVYGWFDLPYMPVEFSVAAYRFGHSMVRPVYDLNATILDRPIFDPAGQPGGGQDLRGFQALLPGWSVEWGLFFPLEASGSMPSRLIDTKLAEGLATLPGGGGNLALRNLQRGRALGLPSGEAVSRRIGIEPLSFDELGLGELGFEEAEASELRGATPLWFYVLAKAEKRQTGLTLGPVGGRIVAETLVGLLVADPYSYLSVDPLWTPMRERRLSGGEGFAMADLVRFVVG